MEQLWICRTCLNTNVSKANYINIFNKPEINQMAVKDMLEIFMPEMDLDISDGDTVICLQCSEALKNAYFFKNTCLKTEGTIYNYLHQHNIELGKKINLSNVLGSKTGHFDFIHSSSNELKYASLPTDSCASTPEKTDNYQRSLMINSPTEHLNLIKSEDETKEVMSQEKRKRKQKNITKKKSWKEYEYNSLKRSYTCDLCEYKAYRLDLLDVHKQKHNKDQLTVKEYKCDLCLYSTPRKRALDRHLFTHEGKSRHLCDVCKKTFAEKYQLKLHALTHTGRELPHKCEECGKGYLTKSYLKQHMETRHLAKKNWCLECDDDKCDHPFSRYYKCNMCEASFSDKRGLDAHKFSHTGGDLPFRCLHCSFSTAWKGNLKKHLQNKH